ncbi:MAG: hypothetical protein QG550_2859 [Pseudomonadota bacterium]|nr:hypothetical protein [Pseudomonadota bacterium]MDQ1342641.1 hypothetical protein [Pseudomonadota bacterium]
MMKTITLAVAMSALLDAAAVQAEPDAATAKSNAVVGTERSNVDEKSSSGSYYPNSADTEVDPDGDEKLTRSECKAWYESQQANDSAPSSATPPGDTGS